MNQNQFIDDRDTFAIAALQGMLAHSRGNPPHGYRAKDGTTPWQAAIAQEAYEIANYMLLAREFVTDVRRKAREAK